MNHGAKLSEKQGFTYWFSFEFPYIVCLLLFLTFLIQMITLIESTKN